MTHLGVIGGGGWLAGALLRPVLTDRIIKPADLVLSSRSGNISGFEAWPGVHMTTDNAILVDASDVIMLSIRPVDIEDLHLDLRGRFVISVMAGVTVEEISDRFGAQRIVRAMPNACAEQRLSFTPWFATRMCASRSWTSPAGSLPRPAVHMSSAANTSWIISRH